MVRSLIELYQSGEFFQDFLMNLVKISSPEDTLQDLFGEGTTLLHTKWKQMTIPYF